MLQRRAPHCAIQRPFIALILPVCARKSRPQDLCSRRTVDLVRHRRQSNRIASRGDRLRVVWSPRQLPSRCGAAAAVHDVDVDRVWSTATVQGFLPAATIVVLLVAPSITDLWSPSTWGAPRLQATFRSDAYYLFTSTILADCAKSVGGMDILVK